MITTLTSLTPLVSRIRSNSLSADDRKALVDGIRLLDDESKVIAAMVRGILNSMSKTNAWTSMLRIVREVREFIDPQAAFSKTRLSVDVDPLVAHLEFPDTPVRQSLFNVVLNALQHLQSCDMKRAKEISVVIEESNQSDFDVSIRVSDNGFGVHFNERERVFDPYFTTRKEGTGFGLYLTRAMIESLGGLVRIKESVRFSGTTFEIELKKLNKKDWQRKVV